ncbi:cation efflux family-domain-containing protein [Blastocladiella britannica]|nr:cation efflux family-domain-containing protein [Blastocladiella britannica]
MSTHDLNSLPLDVTAVASSSSNRGANGGSSATPDTAAAAAAGPSSAIDHPWLNAGLNYRLTASRKSPEELAKLRKTGGAKVARFYEHQNELIDDLLTPLVPVTDEADRDAQVTMVVRLSLVANIILLTCQAVAATLSGSMALFATAADAFMDLLSGAILLVADHAAKRQNVLAYPTGKRRYETVGIIVFSTLMAALSIQIVLEAGRTLAAAVPHALETNIVQYILIGFGLATKTGLYFYCVRLSDHSASARALATDHRNDLVLNSSGLLLAVLGAKLVWWLDPIGALLIGLMIMRSWSMSAWENVQLLVGKSASPAVLNKITYIAATHDVRVRQVDTCRAYWLGNNMFVEVDIVLPPDMTLREAHDIGEDLQIKLEQLPNVERAFVHCDYEFEHRPEHRGD